MNSGRVLVNMVEERDKENISPPIVLNQQETLEDDLKILSRDEVLPNETCPALPMVDESVPSTSKQRMPASPNYYVSPIRSDESDIDDSDADPNFQLILESKSLSKVVPASSSSSTSSSSRTEDDSEQPNPQNAAVTEIFRKACVRRRVLRTKGTGLAIDQPLFSHGLSQAYSEKIALPDAKKDIQDLIKKNVIPKSYYDLFYNGVLGNNDN